MDYRQKLLDPRWQKRRLEILNRDDFTCQRCADTTNTLHVHHRWYNGDPWESTDAALVTLCCDCHEIESSVRKDIEQRLLKVLRARFFTSEVLDIATAIEVRGLHIRVDEDDEFHQAPHISTGGFGG